MTHRPLFILNLASILLVVFLGLGRYWSSAVAEPRLLPTINPAQPVEPATDLLYVSYAKMGGVKLPPPNGNHC
jgi:hypothetical protein